MKLATIAKNWLNAALGITMQTGLPASPESLAEKTFTGPEDVVHPTKSDVLSDHVRFLLHAKHYIGNHPVPESHVDSNNQYSHARSAPIGDDLTKPALTNCSYKYFGNKLVSIGFPTFVRQAPMWKGEGATGGLNPAFNNIMLWESFSRLLTRYTGPLGDGTTKYGFYLPTNHDYIEKPVPDAVFERAQTVIEFLTRTDIEDPKQFLKELDAKIAPVPEPSGSRKWGFPKVDI